MFNDMTAGSTGEDFYVWVAGLRCLAHWPPVAFHLQ
jgi:hypothetical protein